MVKVLIIGMFLSTGIIALSWGIFMALRKFTAFSFLNHKNANKKMLEGSILFYFMSIFIIIYFMLEAV